MIDKYAIIRKINLKGKIMKKLSIAVIVILIMSICVLAGCGHSTAYDTSWINDKNYDLSLPTLGDDWYEVFTDNFDGTALNENIHWGSEELAEKYSNGIWTYSPHGERRKTDYEKHPEYTNYWCDDMVEVKDGYVVIKSVQTDNHVCSSGVCPTGVGRFCGGIETRKIVEKEIVDESGDLTKGDADDILFGQAFGYFEATVKFPKAEGLWSAFWLQSSNQRLISAEGVDGTEIDIYESAFIKNPTVMGNALLWNGYGDYAKVAGSLYDTKTDLYDGFHTFALKWTPNYYVFYVDGNPIWATMGGGVSRVREFLRLTVEMDNGDGYGPHGEKIGKFKDNDSLFLIDSVRVWQNKNYEKYELSEDLFYGELDKKN